MKFFEEFEYRWAIAGRDVIEWSNWEVMRESIHFAPFPGGLLFEMQERPPWPGPGWYASPVDDCNRPVQPTVLYWCTSREEVKDGWHRWSDRRSLA